MKIPKEYATIKRIFNLSLFGIEDAEKNFGKDKKLAFSKEFISYQESFLNEEGSDWNAILTQSCEVYLPKLKKAERRPVAKIIMDNEQLCKTLIITLMLNEKTIKPNQAKDAFMISLSLFIHENKIDKVIVLFIQQHFLRFERIDPSKNENFELDEALYWKVISGYLKVQTEIF